MATYDAFISYSHAKDKSLAVALQRRMQTLGKPWYKFWALWIFRDDTSLSAAPRLQAAIERALSESRFLILLASPEAASSPWVAKEAEYWLNHKSIDTLLIALTDSDLSWDPQAGDFVWSAFTPLPPVLRGRIPDEPKWVDLRRFRNRKDLRRQRNRAFLNLAADLAAAVHGLPKEDLLLQEVWQKKRNLKLAWSAIALLLLLMGAAVWQWKDWSDCRAMTDDRKRTGEQHSSLSRRDHAASVDGAPTCKSLVACAGLVACGHASGT